MHDIGNDDADKTVVPENSRMRVSLGLIGLLRFGRNKEKKDKG